MTLRVVVVHQIVAGVKTCVSFPLSPPLVYPQCFFKEEVHIKNRIHDMTVSVAV